jgi:hypothetical protein
MPTLPEIVEKLSVLVTTSATISVMFTGGVIVIIKDWRASLLAMEIQYIIVGLLLASEIRMELALIKTLVGTLLCLILYLTARAVDWSRRAPLEAAPEDAGSDAAPRAALAQSVLPTEFPFRLLAAALVMFVAYGAALSFPLPDVGDAISLASYALAALGLLAMGLTDEPFKAGLGLLTFVSAFELFYTILEPSLTVVGFLGLSNFLIALAIAYLVVARVSTADLESAGKKP